MSPAGFEPAVPAIDRSVDRAAIGSSSIEAQLDLSLCLIKQHAVRAKGGGEIWLHEFLTLLLATGKWSGSHPGPFNSGDRMPGIE
jgi:hypothetical protein